MPANLKKILLRLKASEFIRNLLIVMSGTAFAQVIGFALMPVISRLFTPEDFGVFGSFNAVVIVITAGATLDYSQAMMLPKDKDDAFHLFLVSCLATVIIGSLCALACLIAPLYLMRLMEAPSLWVLILLVTIVLVTGFSVSLQAWCVRAKAFKQTSASQVIRSLSNNSMQIGLGFLRTGSIGLIVSSVLAELYASINLLRVFLGDLKNSGHKINKVRMIELAREYRDFPIYSASQNIINSLSSGLPILLLAHFFGIGVAGAYAFGVRLLTKPMSLVTGALRQVLFQKAGEIQHFGRSILSLYVRVTVGLFLLGLTPSLILMIWAPQIFKFVFGLQWHTAGEFARSLMFWLLFVFCNVPAVLFARLIRVQRMVFVYNLILLVMRLSVLVIGGLYLTALQSITVFSILGGVMNLALIFLVGYLVMKKEGKISWDQLLSSLKNE